MCQDFEFIPMDENALLLTADAEEIFFFFQIFNEQHKERYSE